MGSPFVLLSFGGIFLYGLSLSSMPRKLSPNGAYLPILFGYGTYTYLAGFLLNSSLSSPVNFIFSSLEYLPSGWGPVDMGALGALFVAGLPFFVLSQTRPATVAGPTSAAGFVSLSAGLAFTSTDSLWLMFVSFEFLLISALYMLLLTSKSERARDAALEMFL